MVFEKPINLSWVRLLLAFVACSIAATGHPLEARIEMEVVPEEIASTTAPYEWSGAVLIRREQTNLGAASGFVAGHPQIVWTAGHAAYDPDSNTWTSDLRWFPQQWSTTGMSYYAGQELPVLHMMAGYVSRRELSDSSTWETFNLDVAVGGAFHHTAGGGHGDYLLSTPTSSPLTSGNRLKMAIGYPASPPSTDRWKMRAHPPADYFYTRHSGGTDSLGNPWMIFRSADIATAGGLSGGGVWVSDGHKWKAAAVHVASNANHRAIDLAALTVFNSVVSEIDHPSTPGWDKIDDFNEPEYALETTIHGIRSWQIIRNPEDARIVRDPFDLTNQVLRYRNAEGHKPLMGAPQNPVTLFFRINPQLAPGFKYDTSFGIIERVNLANPLPWTAFTAQAIFTASSVTEHSLQLGVHNHTGVQFLHEHFLTNQWYNVWYVYDFAASNWSLYINQGEADATESDRVAANISLRSPAGGPLDFAFKAAATLGLEETAYVLIDDIYLEDSMADLSNPVRKSYPAPALPFQPIPSWTLVDSFQEDGYGTGRVVADVNGWNVPHDPFESVIVRDPSDPANQVLYFRGQSDSGHASFKKIAAAPNQAITVYVRVNPYTGGAANNYSAAFGISDQNGLDSVTLNDFAARAQFQSNQASEPDPDLQVIDNRWMTPTTLLAKAAYPIDQWYNLWFVYEPSSQTWDLYMNQGRRNADLNTDLVARNLEMTSPGLGEISFAYRSFARGSTMTQGAILIDDLAIDESGRNLTHPAGSPLPGPPPHDHPTWELVDSFFESDYTLMRSVDGIRGWTTHGNKDEATIADLSENHDDRILRARGDTTHFSLSKPLAVFPEQTVTLFFSSNAKTFGDAALTFDQSFGLTTGDVTEGVTSDAITAQVTLTRDTANPGSTELGVYSSDGYGIRKPSHQTDEWFNFWLVFRVQDQQWDLYLNQGTADADPAADLIARDVSFQNTEAGELHFVYRTSGSNDERGFVAFDNIFLDRTGENLTHPLLPSIRNFSDWQNQYFSAIELDDPEVSDPAHPAALDGIPNLLKYAAKLPPQTPAVLSDLTLIKLDGHGLTMTYRERTDTSDLVYIPEFSEDLLEWRQGDEHLEEIYRYSHQTERSVEYVQVRALPSGDFPKGFLRLRVILAEE